MELRLLRYFVAVAEELHFGHAAKRLHISQPPLSQQIRKLEEELGVRLFSRHQRRVQLTHAGRFFLPEAKQILYQVGRAAEAAKRADRGQIGPLVVACSPIAVQTVLPMVLRVFRARFPEVDLSLRDSTEQTIFEALQERTADVGLLIPYFESNILRREMVLTVPIVAALPSSHPLARRRRIQLKQLGNERFVFFSRLSAPGLYEHTAGLCRRAGFTPNVIKEGTHHPTLLALVGAGYGVALVPGLRRPAAVEGVSFVRIQESWATVQLCMAWRAGDASPLVAAFLAVVKDCCRKAAVKKRRSRASKKR